MPSVPEWTFDSITKWLAFAFDIMLFSLIVFVLIQAALYYFSKRKNAPKFKSLQDNIDKIQDEIGIENDNGEDRQEVHDIVGRDNFPNDNGDIIRLDGFHYTNTKFEECYLEYTGGMFPKFTKCEGNQAILLLDNSIDIKAGFNLASEIINKQIFNTLYIDFEYNGFLPKFSSPGFLKTPFVLDKGGSLLPINFSKTDVIFLVSNTFSIPQ